MVQIHLRGRRKRIPIQPPYFRSLPLPPDDKLKFYKTLGTQPRVVQKHIECTALEAPRLDKGSRRSRARKGFPRTR